MKDVPGWKVGESVYHSGRWVPPASGELRPDVWWCYFSHLYLLLSLHAAGTFVQSLNYMLVLLSSLLNKFVSGTFVTALWNFKTRMHFEFVLYVAWQSHLSLMYTTSMTAHSWHRKLYCIEALISRRIRWKLNWGKIPTFLRPSWPLSDLENLSCSLFNVS